MVLATDWAAMGLPDDTIKGACLTSGLFDLEPVRLSERNGKMDLDAAAQFVKEFRFCQALEQVEKLPAAQGWDLRAETDCEAAARRGRPGQRTSMMQDALAKRPMACEALLGQTQAFARGLGRLLAERGITLVYGGSRVGVMGRVARAAVGAGGASIGVLTRHLAGFELKFEGLTRLELVDTLAAEPGGRFNVSATVTSAPRDGPASANRAPPTSGPLRSQ